MTTVAALRLQRDAGGPAVSVVAFYQNDPDPRHDDWRRAYYGSAASRLERVKQRYDPDRLFDFPQAL